MLTNYKNYGPYEAMALGNKVTINVNDINGVTWDLHITSILNILRDGIETPLVQNSFITILFSTGDSVELSVMDYMVNLIMWKAIISIGVQIQPKHIFFNESITRRTIKSYIDKFLIGPNRHIIDNRRLNNIIDDTLHMFTKINEFSFYLANTINLEDDITLMTTNPEAWDIYHTSLQGYALEDVKKVGMEKTNRLVDIIKNSDFHCLSDFFKAGEGINPKQYKEFAVNIGTKPDGQGGVYPVVIDSSYIRGGLTDIASIFIESSAGRTAQILSKTNVGDSGHFARLLGLNNSDTILHRDPTYVCDSVNFESVHIRNGKMLSMLTSRWYRLSPNGMEYKISSSDTHLIDRVIYLRSPMTCSSKSHGYGICYRCYGDLAYTNNDINIGKLAAEILSSILTQILLSAKHLLESLIRKINWSKKYYDIFDTEANIIYMQDEINTKGSYMIIDPENIILENEDDDFEYNEYINTFQIKDSTGNISDIYSSEMDNMYFSGELNDIIRSMGVPEGSKIIIKLDDLQGLPLFLVKIHNDELSRTLDKLMHIINKNAVTSKFDRQSILQAFLETVLEGGLDINSVHCEVLLSNQIRDFNDIIQEPDWSTRDAKYQILTLNQALTSHPSLTVSLSYERLSKALYNPLTFRKGTASFMDLFFQSMPQKYLNKKYEGGDDSGNKKINTHLNVDVEEMGTSHIQYPVSHTAIRIDSINESCLNQTTVDTLTPCFKIIKNRRGKNNGK